MGSGGAMGAGPGAMGAEMGAGEEVGVGIQGGG
jgi:hypothetical protein